MEILKKYDNFIIEEGKKEDKKSPKIEPKPQAQPQAQQQAQPVQPNEPKEQERPKSIFHDIKGFMANLDRWKKMGGKKSKKDKEPEKEGSPQKPTSRGYLRGYPPPPDAEMDADYFDFMTSWIKKSEKEEVDEERWPIEIDEGDYVEIIDTEGFSEKQMEFIKDKPYFYVKSVTNKKGHTYEFGEPYIDVGYKIPLKMKRFRKVEKDSKYKILFLQFDLPIDVHGEKDKHNFFKGFDKMSDLFTNLFEERLRDDAIVNFNFYDDIYKIGSDYFVNGTCLKDYDFVFFGHISKFTSICKIIVNYLEKFDVSYLKYGSYLEYDNKAYEFHLLDSLGYPYIPSVMTSKLTNRIINIVEKNFGYPVIVKNVTANRGTGVWKIENLKELIKIFRFGMSSSGRLMLIQKYIPNDGDFRVITIKNKVKLVIKKKRINKDEFRSNVARGGKAVKATLPDKIIEMCEEISTKFDGDIIGFDIIQDMETGKYYVMEANSAPRFPTSSVISEVDVPGIITDYIIKQIKKKK